MYNCNSVTVHKGKKRSIINYVYINAFKKSTFSSFITCMFWYLFFNLFCMALASVKRRKKKKKKHIRSLGQMVIVYFVEVENQENWFQEPGFSFCCCLFFLKIHTYINIYVYECSATNTMTVSFSRESFFLVSTLFWIMCGVAAALRRGLEKTRR